MKHSQLRLTVQEHAELKRYCIDKNMPIQLILQDIYSRAIKKLDDYDPAEIRGAYPSEASKSLLFYVEEEDHNKLSIWLAKHDVKKQDWNSYVFKKEYAMQTQEQSRLSLSDSIRAEIKRTGVGGKWSEMDQIKEYVTAHYNGKPLIADGLQEGYRIISEYGGYVLAGMQYSGKEAAHGFQFATWQYAYSGTSVEMGHYYATWQFGTNALDMAKEDFALRSGLVNEDKIFEPELLAEMHHALVFYRDENLELTEKQEKQTKEAMEQIERLLPEDTLSPEPQQGPSINY